MNSLENVAILITAMLLVPVFQRFVIGEVESTLAIATSSPRPRYCS